MRHQPDDGLGDRGLAAAGFANQRKGFLPPDRQADLFHRVNLMRDAAQHPAPHREMHGHIGQLRHNLARRLGAGGGHAHARHGGQKGLSIGLRRMREQRPHRSRLHLRAVLHDHHTVRHFGDNTHVMRDQNDRGAKIPLQVTQKVQHLALHGHIQRRGRLIRNQHLGPQRQSHGDHHPLTHTAGKLMRILRQAPFGLRQTHGTKRLQRAGAGLGAGNGIMGADRLGQLVANRHDRVQGGHRFLKDHRDAVAAQGAHLAFGQPGQLGPTQPHRPGTDCNVWRQQPHDRQRGDGFPRPAFPGNRQGFPPAQVKRQPAHQGLQPRLGRDGNGQSLHRQHGCIRGHRSPGNRQLRRHSNTQRGK